MYTALRGDTPTVLNVDCVSTEFVNVWFPSVHISDVSQEVAICKVQNNDDSKYRLYSNNFMSSALFLL